MKKTGWAILMLVFMLGLAGCGDKPQASAPGESNATDNGITAPGTAEPDPVSASEGEESDVPENTDNSSTEPEMLTSTIKVYFTDDNIEELTAVEREISYSAEADKYETAFRALQTEETGMMSLWKKVVLQQIDLKDGLLAIDITLPDEARLGAGGEALAIDALLQTFFQFDEVKQLEITVDGAKLESLMGHVELEHPYSK
ncbi:GerMN domain-containing protein [Paenibacillus brevis]|uniref:GerMN domain-containing protein n=1 Tax=Paenibacillus brevis TaxID=2841508 RepID=A0ABS6FWY3_9BACL|nr:GerMN domain-containing protein [Paenibacillus brevis]MBU5674411.1 GerMN domain-containing protein [Paenibacillus brevis]